MCKKKMLFMVGMYRLLCADETPHGWYRRITYPSARTFDLILILANISGHTQPPHPGLIASTST
jgi:hypothetical protein